MDFVSDETPAVARPPLAKRMPLWRTVLHGLVDGGPGTCHFAITSVCNARCAFCNFAIDQLPKDKQHTVSLEDAKLALDILARNSIRYVPFIGGEPLIHRDIVEIIAHTRGLGMSSIIVTNGWLLTAAKIDALVEAGLTSLTISVDAPSTTVHDENRGLKGLSDRIRAANAHCRKRGLPTIASVTMSRLVGDYARLPDALRDLGFEAVEFSYPLSALRSSFLSYRESDLVTYSDEELDDAFAAILALKRVFPVLNPSASIDDMRRHIRGEPERFGCLGGYKFFYLDWHLDLYRCHNWDRPMCHITEFDRVSRIHDGCTACMIDCYRDDSVMQHIAIGVSDGICFNRRRDVAQPRNDEAATTGGDRIFRVPAPPRKCVIARRRGP